MNQSNVKTRFAPSPTGHLHVGGARTALFSYLYARHVGGKFLFRIEDTDRERHVEGAADKIVADLKWLSLEWDEGYALGGPNGPYVQSERLEIYAQHAAKLVAGGHAYYAFESSAELDALRDAAEAAKRTFRYQRPAVPVTDPAEADRARAAGKPVVIRFKTPGTDVRLHDEVFGDVSIAAAEQDDFVIVKDDGYPTYHLANVVDDGLMGVTVVMRGQEFLGQTWRQTLLRRALGFPEPVYAHLPLIMDMAGRKLSKRDGDVEVHSFRVAGYLPEVLLNFIALLGWSGGGREKFTLAEMIESFTLERLSKTNAKFDRVKLLAFNTEAVAAAGEDRLLAGFRDFLSVNADEPRVAGVSPAGSVPSGIRAADEPLLRLLLRANHGFRTYRDILDKCAVLFGPDDAYAFDEKSVQKVLAKGDGAGYAVLADLRPILAAGGWSEPDIKAAIDGYCAAKALGMGQVAQPLRVAVTGRTVSPTIYDTLLILGQSKTLARIDRCLAQRGA